MPIDLPDRATAPPATKAPTCTDEPWTDPSTSINRSLVHLAAYIDGREIAYLQILRRRGHGGVLNISGHVRRPGLSGWVKASLPPQPTIPAAVAALEALGAPPMPPATLAALMAAHAVL